MEGNFKCKETILEIAMEGRNPGIIIGTNCTYWAKKLFK